MAMDAKVYLLSTLEQRLSAEITAEAMSKALKAVSDVLEGFDVRVISEWSEEKDDCPALFINRFQERLQPNGVRYMLSCLAKATGVKHVHPHKFRRTLATDLARHGMPIQEVASILGHEKLDTTMTYVVLSKEQTSSSYRRYT